VDDGTAVETEAAVHAGVCDAADPALALSSAVPAAEIAFVVAVVGVGVGFDVERVPIVDVGELEDRSVETVFCVTVLATRVAECDAEVADVWVGEVLTT